MIIIGVPKAEHIIQLESSVEPGEILIIDSGHKPVKEKFELGKILINQEQLFTKPNNRYGRRNSKFKKGKSYKQRRR